MSAASSFGSRATRTARASTASGLAVAPAVVLAAAVGFAAAPVRAADDPLPVRDQNPLVRGVYRIRAGRGTGQTFTTSWGS